LLSTPDGSVYLDAEEFYFGTGYASYKVIFPDLVAADTWVLPASAGAADLNVLAP